MLRSRRHGGLYESARTAALIRRSAAGLVQPRSEEPDLRPLLATTVPFCLVGQVTMPARFIDCRSGECSANCARSGHPVHLFQCELYVRCETRECDGPCPFHPRMRAPSRNSSRLSVPSVCRSAVTLPLRNLTPPFAASLDESREVVRSFKMCPNRVICVYGAFTVCLSCHIADATVL